MLESVGWRGVACWSSDDTCVSMFMFEMQLSEFMRDTGCLSLQMVADVESMCQLSLLR
jgi:hypothetical protein